MYHKKLVCLMCSYKQVKAKAIMLLAKVAYSKASLPCQFKSLDCFSSFFYHQLLVLRASASLKVSFSFSKGGSVAIRA